MNNKSFVFLIIIIIIRTRQTSFGPFSMINKRFTSDTKYAPSLSRVKPARVANDLTFFCVILVLLYNNNNCANIGTNKVGASSLYAKCSSKCAKKWSSESRFCQGHVLSNVKRQFPSVKTTVDVRFFHTDGRYAFMIFFLSLPKQSYCLQTEIHVISHAIELSSCISVRCYCLHPNVIIAKQAAATFANKSFTCPRHEKKKCLSGVHVRFAIGV